MPLQETLKRSKASLIQSLLRGGSLFLSLGPDAYKDFVCPFRASLVDIKFDSKHNCTSPTILLGLLLYRWIQSIFFQWGQTFSC